jgi:3-oxoacyl-[acyl-carrier-protein] synthase-3
MNNQIGISAIEISLPNNRLSIAEMAMFNGDDAALLEKKLGISEKPVLADNQNINDFALQAAKILLEKNNLNPDLIDLIIHASCGLEEKQLWSLAAKVQKEIGAKNAFSFDIQNGCNAGNLALDIAIKLLNADDSKKIALLIIADPLATVVDYKDPIHKCIFNFSDAASAVLISKDSTINKFLSSAFTTEALFADSMHKLINNKHIWLNDDPEEDKLLIKEYINSYTHMIELALQKAGKDINDVSQIIMNQGDHKLITKIAMRLGLPVDLMFRSHKNFGHLGGSDIFFGLNHVLEHKVVKSGDIVVLASSALGFSWGASVIQI